MNDLLRRSAAAGEDGLRVDVALSRWLDEPRSRTQARLAAGEVRVDGAVVAKSHRLETGQQVRVASAPAPSASPPPTPVPVRYEDEHLAVVAKPAGLVVHGGAGVTGATLVDVLQAMNMALAPAEDPKRPGIVHRLDRPTSGLLLIAKTQEARARLLAAFKAHRIERAYWALVDGVPQSPQATIDAPLARHPRRRTRFQVDQGGRRAVSHYDLDESFGRAAALSVRLESGRTHQVRVHMASIGHPVSGDRAYGASRTLAAELELTRPALHARRLGLDHPLTGERLELEEPLPDDLVEALRRLRA